MELTWNGKADDELMISNMNHFCSEVGYAIFGVDKEGVLNLISLDANDDRVVKIQPGQAIVTDNFPPTA